MLAANQDLVAQEQQLLGWQFLTSGPGNTPSTGNEITYNSTEHHTGVTISVLKRASGLRNHALAAIFGGIPDMLIPDFETAKTKSYYEFNFQPKANYEMSLSQLNFKIRTSGTWSPGNATSLYFIWKYSVDGGANFSDIGTVTQLPAAVQDVRQPTRVLSGIPELQGLTNANNVIFRLYIWGFTNAAGSGTFGIGRSTAADPIALSISGTSKYLGNITSGISEAYFTDSKAIAKGEASGIIMDKLISMINNTPTGERIHMSIYLINHQGVMDALKAAEARGVNLHIIVDMSRSDSQITNANSLPWLQSNLPSSEIVVSVNDVSANAINHHKFALFTAVQTQDGVLRNATFQTSHNFTVADTKKIQDALVFNNSDVYQAFLNNWELIKANASSGMKANFNFNSYDLPSINTKLEFFPRIVGGIYDGKDNIVDHLNAITDVANAKIRIAMSDWSDSRPAIVNKLIELRNLGATIEVFAKDAAGTQTKAKLNQLSQLGAVVRIFNLESGGDAKFNIHAKMMLIEGAWQGQTNSKVIITGSHNYTDGALKTNNEVLVTLVNSSLYAQYNSYFNAIKTVVPTVQLLAWDLSAITGAVGEEFSEYPSSFASGVYVSKVTRGEGLQISRLSKGFSSSKAADLAVTVTADEAIARDEYLEFIVRPMPGKKVSVKELMIKIRRTAGGGQKLQLAYQLNKETLVKIGSEISVPQVANGVFLNPISLADIAEFQNLTYPNELKIKMYMYGETSRGGTFALGQNDTAEPVLQIRGDLESVSDPALILGWSASDLSGTTASFTSTNTSKSVTSATITRGAGLEASSLSAAFSSRTKTDLDFTTIIDKTSAIANDSYLEFSFTVKPEYKISLSELYLKTRRSGAGAKSYLWQYSIDGGVFEDIGSEVLFTNSNSAGVNQIPSDLTSVAALQSIPQGKTVTLRLYTWGYTSAAGSFALGLSENPSEDVLMIRGKLVESPLPVSLTKFEAAKNNSSVKLYWQTASEQSNSHFEILKSSDGKEWNLLTTVSGAGNSTTRINYQYVDNHPFSGINYYQLKQVDFDGKSNLSEVASVNFDIANTASGIAASYSSQMLTVFADGLVLDKGKLQVHNTSGQLLKTQNVTNINSGSIFALPVTLKSGIYIVSLNSEKGITTTKIIVN